MSISFLPGLLNVAETEEQMWVKEGKTYVAPVYNATSDKWDIDCRLDECNIKVEQIIEGGKR